MSKKRTVAWVFKASEKWILVRFFSESSALLQTTHRGVVTVGVGENNRRVREADSGLVFEAWAKWTSVWFTASSALLQTTYLRRCLLDWFTKERELTAERDGRSKTNTNTIFGPVNSPWLKYQWVGVWALLLRGACKGSKCKVLVHKWAGFKTFFAVPKLQLQQELGQGRNDWERDHTVYWRGWINMRR